MSAPTRKTQSKKKEPAATATSASIEKQVQEFLAKGGNIEQIKSGVSGQQSLAGRKHIKLGNSQSATRSGTPEPATGTES
ncbi:MAG: hypothetical protein CSA52_01080 [Gammaproteobacteria bacterium]|nr:MAG: hypothetical protein CSB48_12990 [Pseudomonadota bacterium]PIE38775.1 MAG: hypothetical protein CSA52_01080 [Gammaproteobacteria bacterium]